MNQPQKSDSTEEKLVAAVRKFVREDVVPSAAKYDDAKGEFPWDVVRKAHQLGFMNTDTPKELGGLGLNLSTKTRIFQELAYGCTAIATTLMISELAQIPLLKHGSDHIKQKYIRTLTKEPALAAYATTEHDAGSDLAHAQLKAVKDGDSYVLNGTKDWICNCGVSRWIFILARTSNDASTGKAFTGFIIEREMKGVTVGHREINMGQKAADIRGLSLVDVRVPKENIVGEVGQGFSIAMEAFDRVRPVLASLGCGVQQRALDEATNYALQRDTFGKSLIEHQGIGFKLADMAQKLEASKLLTQQAAQKVECNDPNATYFSSIAKCFSADAAFKAASEAVQVFGANGYNIGYPVEKLLRDSKALQIMGGTCEIQRVVIARELSKQYSQSKDNV